MARAKPLSVGRELARRTGRPAPADRLLNLGPQSSAWLHAAGIRTRADLARVGVAETCRRIHAAGRPVSVLFAYALEGALTDTHWNRIPHETKLWLRAEFALMKARPRA